MAQAFTPDWPTIATYASLLVGVAGLLYALYERRQKARLAEFARANNWLNYHRAENSNGTLQVALNLYKKRHEANLDPDVLEQLARADAHGQELFKEIVRQIQMTEPSFVRNDFMRWMEEGKISEEKVKLFMKFSADAKNSSAKARSDARK